MFLQKTAIYTFMIHDTQQASHHLGPIQLGLSINHFQNKPSGFYVCSKSLLKTLWEKEKLLITNNFSFSNSIFYPLVELSAMFIQFKAIAYKFFQFLRVQNLSHGKGLTNWTMRNTGPTASKKSSQANSFSPGQPAQTAQANVDEYKLQMH